LDELPAERIQGEWLKLLLRGREIGRGLDLARRTGILERVFPQAFLCDAPTVNAAMDALVPVRDHLEPEGRRIALMMTAWLHRGSTDGVIATLDQMWLHKWKHYPLRDRVTEAVSAWNSDLSSDADLRHLSTRAELQITLLVRQVIGDQDEAGALLERARTLGILHEPPPRLLQGRNLKELGVKPGPDMGRLIKEVYKQQLDGGVTTVEQAMDAARSLLKR
jgi:tRNA nucleotidyltransferase/poly(A) polymerase